MFIDMQKKNMEKAKLTKAKELFFKAKELDALRFRAPQKINESQL